MEIFHNPEAALPAPVLKSGPAEIGRMVIDTAGGGVPEAGYEGPAPFGLGLMTGVRADPEAPPSSHLGNRAQTSTITNLDGKNDEKFIDDAK